MTDGLTTGRRADRERALSLLREAASSPEAAGAALRGLTQPRQWLALDLAVRAEWHVEGWTGVLRIETPLAVALSACARSGRVRERAVGLLTSDDLLPVLAIRATDWVSAVQDSALELIADLLADPSPQRFQAVLEMAAAMRDRSRATKLTAIVNAALVLATREQSVLTTVLFGRVGVLNAFVNNLGDIYRKTGRYKEAIVQTRQTAFLSVLMLGYLKELK